MVVYRSFIQSGLLEREGLPWLAGLKTRVRVGLLVITVSGLPLSILYKGTCVPTWLIHVLELDPQKSIEHPEMWEPLQDCLMF